MTICQLQKVLIASFLVSTIAGCANAPVDEKRDERKIAGQWNKLPPRFTEREDDESVVANPFFDVDPNIKNMAPNEANNFAINYIVTTPEESDYLYDLDLFSGKLYRQRAFCPQDDIWDNYRADLITPNFTQGVVPRVYDELKNPMKVVVISNKEKIEPFKENPTHFDNVRILGSVVVDECSNYPCDVKEKWKSSQILFGVNTRDSQFNSVSSFNDLKRKVDWSYAKGMLTNMHGYHRVGGKIFPAFRISKELNLKDTYAYFQKTAEVINTQKFVELNKWRGECMKLYDTTWDEVEKIRGQKSGQAESFLKYFKEFYSKNSNEFYQCQKLVRPGSITENMRRFWFFTYIQAFTLLEKSGFYYSCTDNSWAYNPRVDDKRFYVSQIKELDRCRAKNFEGAFDQAINGMSLMKNQINSQYRFVEYDNVRGGSHQKIYGWVFDKIQNYACKYESKKPTQTPFDVFPQDVVWENFKQDEGGLIK